MSKQSKLSGTLLGSGKGMVAGIKVKARKPHQSHEGLTTGSLRCCSTHGCTGIRMAVRWPNKKITWICTKGIKVFKHHVQIL